MARVVPAEFHLAVRRIWGRKILARATHGLAATRPQFSARKRLTLTQGATLLILALCFGLISAYLPLSVLWVAASAALGLFFFSFIALRLCCLLPVPAARGRSLEYPGERRGPCIFFLCVPFSGNSVSTLLAPGRLKYRPYDQRTRSLNRERCRDSARCGALAVHASGDILSPIEHSGAFVLSSWCLR